MFEYFQGRVGDANADLVQIEPWVDFHEKVVLDLGCGTGGKSLFWSRLGARCVVGIDLTPDILVVPQLLERSSRTENPPRFVAADGVCLPFADESFDLITIHDVLEHLTEPQKVIDECQRVLKASGLVSIITPHYYGLSGNHLWNYLDGSYWRYLHPHLIFPQAVLHRLVRNVGERRGYSDSQIAREWNQFRTLNRSTVNQIRDCLRAFEIKQFAFRQPEVGFIRFLTSFLGLQELFSYGVVIVAAKTQDGMAGS